MIIVLLGPPASGKGTQAHFLSQLYGFHHIAVGHLLRRAAAAGDAEIAALLQTGAVLPADVVGKVVAAELAGIGTSIVLDGYPRSPEQARDFLSTCTNKNAVTLIDLHVADTATAALSARTARRRQLESRADDTEPMLQVRLEEFHRQHPRVLELFAQAGVRTCSIDATLPPTVVFDHILMLLQSSAR